MNVYPDKIYFFNDSQAYGNKYNNLIQKDNLVSDLAKQFKSSKVVTLDYDDLCQKINCSISKEITYDAVVMIGEKGKILFDQIKRNLRYRDLYQIDVKRIFSSDFSEGFDCKYNVKQIPQISFKQYNKILIVDDIVYTGGTIRALVNSYNLDINRCLIVTLIKFKDFNEPIEQFCGYVVDEYTWPNGDSELWCLWDFIEKDSCPNMSKKYQTLIDNEKFCRNQVFGENYLKAKEIIDRMKRYELTG